jgi:hypothetical protein
MITRCILAAFAGIALAPAAEAATIYECKITRVAPSGWVSELMFFSVDENGQTATAYDYFIDQAYDNPIPVKLTLPNSNSLKFNWELQGLKSGNGGQDAGRIAYRATINKSTRKIRVGVTLLSYDNSSNGEGTCAIKK